MSADVLLNLLKKLRESDKIWGLLSILLLFRNKFEKFNNTGEGILDSIHQMSLKLLWNHIWAEYLRFCHYLRHLKVIKSRS